MNLKKRKKKKKEGKKEKKEEKNIPRKNRGQPDGMGKEKGGENT